MAIGFAHRGARARAPENTLPSFRLALELGATGLESDVWLTRDGVAVLDHDGVVRGDGPDRPIGELARRELPDHVPELRELYAACGVGYELSLDLKDAGAADEVIAVARAAGALERLWLCHGDWRVVAALRERSTLLKLVDSTRIRRIEEGAAERARRLVAAGIDAVNLHVRDWSAELVRTFREAGLAAFAWDAQTDAVLRETLALGVDAVYSDHVDRMMAALAAQESGGVSGAFSTRVSQ